MNLPEIAETSGFVFARSPKACNFMRTAKSVDSRADFVDKYPYEFSAGDISGPNYGYICKEVFLYVIFLDSFGVNCVP